MSNYFLENLIYVLCDPSVWYTIVLCINIIKAIGKFVRDSLVDCDS